MTDPEQLPWRVERRLVDLGMPAHLEVCPQPSGNLPNVRCVLPKPATGPLSLVLRVHSRAGIPLAQAFIDLKPGDRSFETPLALMSMEGYRHLSQRARQDVERRVWSRRAFATGSVT